MATKPPTRHPVITFLAFPEPEIMLPVARLFSWLALGAFLETDQLSSCSVVSPCGRHPRDIPPVSPTKASSSLTSAVSRPPSGRSDLGTMEIYHRAMAVFVGKTKFYTFTMGLGSSNFETTP